MHTEERNPASFRLKKDRPTCQKKSQIPERKAVSRVCRARKSAMGRVVRTSDVQGEAEETQNPEIKKDWRANTSLRSEWGEGPPNLKKKNRIGVNKLETRHCKELSANAHVGISRY